MKFSILISSYNKGNYLEDCLNSCLKQSYKNYEIILENYNLYVYPRISEGKVETLFDNHDKIHHVKAPIMEISSTFIRNAIKGQKNIRPLLPTEVWNYIDEMNFYR